MSEELKPCPFCGSEAEISVNTRVYNSQKDNEHDYGVCCTGCKAKVGVDDAQDFYGDCIYDFEYEDDAIKAWNTRPKRD